MATLQHYRDNLFEIIDDNNEYSGHTFFATKLFDHEVEDFIPVLQVTGTIWVAPFYDGVDENKVKKAINNFITDFDIVIDNQQLEFLINTIYTELSKI